MIPKAAYFWRPINLLKNRPTINALRIIWRIETEWQSNSIPTLFDSFFIYELDKPDQTQAQNHRPSGRGWVVVHQYLQVSDHLGFPNQTTREPPRLFNSRSIPFVSYTLSVNIYDIWRERYRSFLATLINLSRLIFTKISLFENFSYHNSYH